MELVWAGLRATSVGGPLTGVVVVDVQADDREVARLIRVGPFRRWLQVGGLTDGVTEGARYVSLEEALVALRGVVDRRRSVWGGGR